MSESIFVRVQRVISAGADNCMAVAERASGTGLMREAIRQVDRAVDDVRAEQDACRARRAAAEERQWLVSERLTTLEEQARFALGKGREDLAAAALARQIEYEQEARRLRKVEADAAAQLERLDQSMRDLKLRKSQMEKELAAFQSARAKADSAAGKGAAERAERRAERAEEAFERAMSSAGGVSVGLGLGECEEAAKLAEVESLQKESAVADRLAALRAKQERAGSAKPAKGGARRRAG